MLQSLFNLKSLTMIFAIILFAFSFTIAQEKSACCSSHKDGKGSCKTMETKTMQDSTKKVIKETLHNHSGETVEVESIVREGAIDLAAIDENGDGKVYQDQMCWNVLSDEKGECPLCGMTLKEVGLEEAKANLEDNGYNVK